MEIGDKWICQQGSVRRRCSGDIAMTKYVLMIALALSSCNSLTKESIEFNENLNNTLWIAYLSDWNHMPYDPDIPPISTAKVELMRFLDNGDFTILRCYIIAGADTVDDYDSREYLDQSNMSISTGDPKQVIFGNWKAEDSEIFLSLTHIWPSHNSMKSSEIRLLFSGNFIEMNGVTFRKTNRINLDNYLDWVNTARNEIN
jgi:hypothetical protein